MRAALAGPLSRPRRKILGLRELVELPREEAERRSSCARAGYAAYQRKWMRRIPGLVSVPADRPAEEVADDDSRGGTRRERVPLVERAELGAR